MLGASGGINGESVRRLANKKQVLRRMDLLKCVTGILHIIMYAFDYRACVAEDDKHSNAPLRAYTFVHMIVPAHNID